MRLRERTSARALWLVTLVALFSSLFMLPAAAQSTAEDGSDFEVLQVDLTGNNGLVAFRPPTSGEGVELELDIEGSTVLANGITGIQQSPIDTFTVMVIDDSETGDSIAGFSEVKASALAYLDRLGAGTRVMLIRAGGSQVEIRPEVGFTTDHSEVRTAINNLQPEGGAVTWNAIAESTKAFSGRDGLRNVVVFAASPGLASTAGAADIAQGNLLSSNSTLTVVAPQAANLDVSDFRRVSSEIRGGLFLRASSEVSMIDVGARAAEIHEGYLVGTFDSSSIVGFDAANVDATPTTEMTVRYQGASERVRVVPGGVALSDGLVPPPLVETSRFGILRGSQGALIAIGLAVVAALLFSFSMLQIFAGDDDSLNSTLSVYGAQDRTDEQRAADEAFASQRSKIIEQVVEKAEEAAASRGNLGSTTSLLEKAEIPLRAGEAFAIQVGVVLVAMLLGFLFSGGNPLIALAFAVPGAMAPILYVKLKVRRRAKKLENQLPDTLQLLASTLKAGYSFVQGMDAVGNEAEEPLAGEFRRTVNEARLGKDLDVALDDLAERVESIDLLWAIIAIKIQREVGGNLAELLNTVADTMTARTRLRGEVAALTAEGRISALVLIFLPFGVGLAMWFLNPDYISQLWNHTLGYAAIGAALVNILIGAVWMKKIIDIEI